MTVSIVCLLATLRVNDSQHNDTTSAVMLSVNMLSVISDEDKEILCPWHLGLIL
jgi:hypothetical protein